MWEKGRDCSSIDSMSKYLNFLKETWISLKKYIKIGKKKKNLCDSYLLGSKLVYIVCISLCLVFAFFLVPVLVFIARNIKSIETKLICTVQLANPVYFY